MSNSSGFFLLIIYSYDAKMRLMKFLEEYNMAGFLNLTKERVLNKVIEIDVEKILPNPNQPRSWFTDNELNKLADSISINGILQPLSVRKIDNRYEIIAGERRLKAAKICGLKSVPCIVYEKNERDSAILALIENIQRQDLTFFEEANAIEKLITHYGMTQEEAALKLGKAQSTIANKLRLLRLTQKEREIILKFELTERHARYLLKLGSPEERLIVLEKIIKHNLNVEKTERLIDEYIGSKKERASYKTTSKVFQNVKMFVNTINKAVETMQAAGISADSKKIQNENYIEYRVRIPIQNKT